MSSDRNEAEGAIDAAQAASRRLAGDVDAQMAALGELPGVFDPARMDLLGEIRLDVRIELGRAAMDVRDVRALAPGKQITLDRSSSDPVDIYLNDRLVARGLIEDVDGEAGVRITEIVSATGAQDERLAG